VPTAILTPAQAREFLGSSAGDLSNDALLQEYIDAVTLVIEDASKPAATDTRTFTMDGGREAITLPVPFVSVSSVVESGVSLSASDYVAYGGAGLLFRGNTKLPWCWAWGVRNITVTVTVGSAGTIPANVTIAAKELLKHMWSRRQGPRPAVGIPGIDQAATPAGYLIPNYVAALLKPSQGVPGFA
jgi:hypothetical protein